jgi:ribosomal protein S17E
MGKIKPKLVKKNAGILLSKGIDFTPEFEKNKKLLGDVLPSKKIRNQMAGYLTRLKKQETK